MPADKDKTSEDLELESAIGDVFKQFNLEHMDQQAEPQETAEDDAKHEHHYDLNFDDAIKDAFQSLDESRQALEESSRPGSRTPDPQGLIEEHRSPQGGSQQGDNVSEEDNDNNHDQSSGDEPPAEVDELDLEGVIENAIESIQKPIRQDSHDEDKQDDHSELKSHDNIAQDNPEHNASSSEHHTEYSPLAMEKDVEYDDLELQNAIGNAFESLKEKHGESIDESLHKAITQSIQSATTRESANAEEKLDINSIVSNIVSQASQDDSANIISEDVLQELAKEITNKVHHETEGLSKAKAKNLIMPQIDENVLDHFVNEANREATKPPDEQVGTEQEPPQDELQATIASAVRNALENENKGDNLDQLQMNDILTNAFNMAMENPSELLSNLEPEETALDNVKQKEQKKLSIAETLALHRSNMKNDTRPELNAQLSSVLANLSSRFNSLESDQNLLSVIKRMTSFLTNSNVHNFRNSQSLISTFTSYKHNGLEEIFVNSLNLAKEYSRQNDKSKAISLIENVLALFGKNSTNDVLDYNFNLVTLINNSIINTITNFSNLKTFKNAIFDKPKVDSPEYKERIRLENRERKKKWREINSERNKDNDLRSRVLKRASLMYGEEPSPEKSTWVEEEFNRRRERRIAKQNKSLEDKVGMSPELSNNDTYINDKNLIQLISDFFDVFSNLSPKDDPEIGLYTTSIAMSCAGVVYLTKVNSTLEVKRIDTIISSVVANLINSFSSLDQQERIIYLSKGSNLNQHLKDIDYPSKLPDPELSALINSRGASIQSSTSSILSRISSTVRELTSSDNASKRLKVSSDIRLDQHRSNWPSTVNLKFPSYKGNPTTQTQAMKKEPTPFISNKISSGSTIESNLPGLKKPGVFQRPAYSKPDSRGKSLGLPLHSTIKQNNT